MAGNYLTRSETMENHALTEEQKFLIVDLLRLTNNEFREEFKRLHIEGDYSGAENHLVAIYEINDIIDLKRAQIATIAEYKKSLIYEYATGKKEL